IDVGSCHEIVHRRYDVRRLESPQCHSVAAAAAPVAHIVGKDGEALPNQKVRIRQHLNLIVAIAMRKQDRRAPRPWKEPRRDPGVRPAFDADLVRMKVWEVRKTFFIATNGGVDRPFRGDPPDTQDSRQQQGNGGRGGRQCPVRSPTPEVAAVRVDWPKADRHKGYSARLYFTLRTAPWSRAGTQPAAGPHGARYTSRHPPVGSATPTTVPIIAPTGESTSLPAFGNQMPGPALESATAPAARPTPVPTANPMSVFRPRCPGRFSATLRMSCRESISWLVVALTASDSGVTRCMNPRRVLPFASVTRISAPVTRWLRLAQFAMGLACWAAAVAARAAANRAGKKMCLGVPFIKGFAYQSTSIVE